MVLLSAEKEEKSLIARSNYIHESGLFVCGAFSSPHGLIRCVHVLTHQFCFCCFCCSTSTFDWVVYLGRESQQGLNLNEVSRGLEEVIKHPDYDKNSKDNDICLLKLSSTVDFTNYIRPVCLAAPGSSFTGGTSCWVTGWGNIRSGGEYGGCRTDTKENLKTKDLPPRPQRSPLENIYIWNECKHLNLQFFHCRDFHHFDWFIRCLAIHNRPL